MGNYAVYEYGKLYIEYSATYILALIKRLTDPFFEYAADQLKIKLKELDYYYLQGCLAILNFCKKGIKLNDFYYLSFNYMEEFPEEYYKNELRRDLENQSSYWSLTPQEREQRFESLWETQVDGDLSYMTFYWYAPVLYAYDENGEYKYTLRVEEFVEYPYLEGDMYNRAINRLEKFSRYIKNSVEFKQRSVGERVLTSDELISILKKLRSFETLAKLY